MFTIRSHPYFPGLKGSSRACDIIFFMCSAGHCRPISSAMLLIWILAYVGALSESCIASAQRHCPDEGRQLVDGNGIHGTVGAEIKRGIDPDTYDYYSAPPMMRFPIVKEMDDGNVNAMPAAHATAIHATTSIAFVHAKKW